MATQVNYLCKEDATCLQFVNRGLTPIYVGKAEKTFKQETFNSSNKTKYYNGFSKYAKALRPARRAR